MGLTRNGARTFLNLLHRACQLSHLPGFVAGLRRILSTQMADDLYALWTPLCTFVEALVALDTHFNMIDHVEEVPGSEDIGV